MMEQTSGRCTQIFRAAMYQAVTWNTQRHRPTWNRHAFDGINYETRLCLSSMLPPERMPRSITSDCAGTLTA
jgi:hypothetical protein